MKIYTWTDGRTFNYLPNPFENTSPVSEKWWVNHGGTISEIPDPPEPTPIYTYSKYKLKLACESRNLWQEVKSYIEQSGKWESFLLITEISSDNAEFEQVLSTIKEAFGAELVEAVLVESIAE